MRSQLTLAALLALAPSSAFAVNLTDFSSGSFTDTNGTLPYRYFIPVDYDENDAYPLVLFFHGQGEIGTDNKKHLNCNGSDQNCHMNGIATWISGDNLTAYPMFLVAPQLYSGNWEGSAVQTQILGVLADVQAAYNIDPDRIYVTGLSLGGGGTTATINNSPTLFAAACEQSGWGSGNAALAHMPIWAFHAADDARVGVAGSDNFVAGLRNNGGAPIYTRYATGDHAIWSKAYSTPELLPWMMRQRLGVPDQGPPGLRITSPSAEPEHGSPTTSLTFAGVTDESLEVSAVTWTNNLGGSGTATGTTSFSASVELQDGVNQVAFLAHTSSTAYQKDLGGETTFGDVVKVTYPGVLSVGLIVEPGSLKLDENGGTGTLSVRLDKVPNARGVSLRLFNGSSSEVSVTPEVLTFATANYNVSQTVTVTAIDDDVVGSHEAVLTVHIDDSASDEAYAEILDRTVRVTLTDDDALPLLVWLGLDEASGTSTTNAGSLGGTYAVNSGTFGAGHTGNAITFSGDARINLGNPAELNFAPSQDDFTVSAWFKTSTQGAIVSKAQSGTDGVQYYVFVFQNQLYARVGSGTDRIVPVTVNDDAWHLATLVNQGSENTATLYLDDGTNKVTFAPGSTGTSSLPVLVGARHNGAAGTYAFQMAGSIDDVRILSRALSADDVSDLYDGAFETDTDPRDGEAPTLRTTSLAQGAVSIAYQAHLAAVGEVPLTWTITGGTLPPGLTLEGSGRYAGTPTTAGSYDFTVQVTNAVGQETLTLTHVVVDVSELTGGDDDSDENDPGKAGAKSKGSCSATGSELLACLAVLLLRRRNTTKA